MSIPDVAPRVRQPNGRLDSRHRIGEARPVALGRLLARAPGADRGGGTTEASGNVNALADLGARTREWARRAAERSDRERELLPGGQIAADDRAQDRRRALANSGGDLTRFLLVALRKRERDQNPEGTRGHRGQVAERRRRRAVADLEAVEPIAVEVNAFHRCVGADDEALAHGNVEHGGVVADPLRGLPPFGEKDSNEVEFLAGPEVEIATVGRPVRTHRATAGSSASTGGSGGGSISFHARGRA